MKNKYSLTLSPYYRRFSYDRNRALDSIYQKYIRALDVVAGRHNQAVLEAAGFAARVGEPRNQLKYLETRIGPLFDSLEHKVYTIILGLRRVTYALSYLSEAEALARTLPKDIRIALTQRHIQEVMMRPIRGVQFTHMIHYLVQKLKMHYLDAIHHGAVLGGGEEIVSRVDRVLKKKRIHHKPKWPSLKEAAGPNQPEDRSLSLGFIDDAEWANIIDNYTSSVPFDLRSPDFAIDESERSAYGWEIEQELTDDFVGLTRAGKIDVANENGISDFQWIAIVDNKTDDCCLWRDGLTSSEIQKALDGEQSDDECTAVVPPAHMNCRCDLAPMTDAMPEDPPSDLGDFETWLTNS